MRYQSITRSVFTALFDLALYYGLLFGFNILFCNIDSVISSQRVLQYIQSSFHDYYCEIPVIYYKNNLGGLAFGLVSIGYIIQRQRWLKEIKKRNPLGKQNFARIKEAKMQYYIQGDIFMLGLCIISYLAFEVFF